MQHVINLARTGSLESQAIFAGDKLKITFTKKGKTHWRSEAPFEFEAAKFRDFNKELAMFGVELRFTGGGKGAEKILRATLSDRAYQLLTGAATKPKKKSKKQHGEYPASWDKPKQARFKKGADEAEAPKKRRGRPPGKQVPKEQAKLSLESVA